MNKKQSISRQWVHVVAERELVKRLDQMVQQNGSDRSKFVRLLIKQEWERRQRATATIDQVEAA